MHPIIINTYAVFVKLSKKDDKRAIKVCTILRNNSAAERIYGLIEDVEKLLKYLLIKV